MIPYPTEGKAHITGGNVYYKIFGTCPSEKTPLVILHGGPGCPHDYLLPLSELADERAVIFYDQLGCGQSDKPSDLSLWQLQRFVDELHELLAVFKLEKIYLLGHSWGGALATEYALQYPNQIEKLILASPLISVKHWIDDADKLKSTLPKETQEVIDRNEKAGTTTTVEYAEAAMIFSKKFMCRLDPWPECLMKAIEGFGFPVYNTMWGPSEFCMNGNLKNFERIDQLKEICCPVLLICGEYDEATPETMKLCLSKLKNVQLEILKDCSHNAHLENTKEYLKILRDFITK